MKPNICEFTETAVVFEDGSKEDDIDFVVFATGYSFSFPFLGNSVRVIENQTALYKFVFPPHLEQPTLAIIGLVQPLGAIMPISELQARWAVRVFKGKSFQTAPFHAAGDLRNPVFEGMSYTGKFGKSGHGRC